MAILSRRGLERVQRMPTTLTANPKTTSITKLAPAKQARPTGTATGHREPAALTSGMALPAGARLVPLLARNGVGVQRHQDLHQDQGQRHRAAREAAN
jgi:hypothetical protein